MIQDEIHQRALEVSKRLRATEKELQEVLREVEKHKVFMHFGHASLFRYAVDALGLTPDVAYNHISVARASVKIPELKKAIDSQEITVSQARHLTSALTKENQTQLISLAKSCTRQELQKEIAKISPEKDQFQEKARYISESRIDMGVHVSEELMKKIRRIQDLVAQGQRRLVTLEETLEAMVEEYLERKDPLRKAQRAQTRKETKEPQFKLEQSTQNACTVQVEPENEDQERDVLKQDGFISITSNL